MQMLHLCGLYGSGMISKPERQAETERRRALTDPEAPNNRSMLIVMEINRASAVMIHQNDVPNEPHIPHPVAPVPYNFGPLEPKIVNGELEVVGSEVMSDEDESRMTDRRKSGFTVMAAASSSMNNDFFKS